jgi:hypothetical protein
MSQHSDRWCTPACGCLLQAAAAGDLDRIRGALAAKAPYTRKHGIDTSLMAQAAPPPWSPHDDLPAPPRRERGEAWPAGQRRQVHPALGRPQPPARLAGPPALQVRPHRNEQTCLHKAVETGYAAIMMSAAEFPRLCVIEDSCDIPAPQTAPTLPNQRLPPPPLHPPHLHPPHLHPPHLHPPHLLFSRLVLLRSHRSDSDRRFRVGSRPGCGSVRPSLYTGFARLEPPPASSRLACPSRATPTTHHRPSRVRTAVADNAPGLGALSGPRIRIPAGWADRPHSPGSARFRVSRARAGPPGHIRPALAQIRPCPGRARSGRRRTATATREPGRSKPGPTIGTFVSRRRPAPPGECGPPDGAHPLGPGGDPAGNRGRPGGGRLATAVSLAREGAAVTVRDSEKLAPRLCPPRH